MESNTLVDILTRIAWPLTTLALVFLFRSAIIKILSRIADSAIIKTIKLKVFGAEIELTPEQAKEALDELLKDIVETTNELSEDEVQLFKNIKASNGRSNVITLLPGFVRDNSKDHEKLRALRDRKLIRPVEGGRWQEHKHPIISRYGDIVWGIKDKVLGS